MHPPHHQKQKDVTAQVKESLSLYLMYTATLETTRQAKSPLKGQSPLKALLSQMALLLQIL